MVAPAEMTTPANNVQHSPVPETFFVDEFKLWAGAEKLTSDSTFLPSVGFSPRIPLMVLGQIAQIAEPEIQAVSLGIVAYSVLEAMKPAAIDSALVGMNVPLPDKIAQPVTVSNPSASIDDSRQFAPPAQYSRQDLGSGVGDLLRLITGQALTKSADGEVQTNVVLTSKPLIYVHHGLGVSPETVRKVMQKLASNGYESIYQIGVPFRIGRTNVRFYHAIDMNLAKEIAGAVIPLVDGPQFSEPRDFSRYSKPPRAGTIDIWLSDKA